jgi:general transcription factor 3C polypeptide 3 (transcription factor C subunit 4)
MTRIKLTTDYLLRAYELNPYDAYICLMITQAFFGRSMNRQSDNRNYQIAQACPRVLLI